VSAKRLSMPSLMIGLAIVVASSMAVAEPYAYSVNSRGFVPDDQMHRLWRLDLATGATQQLGQTGFLDIEGLAFDAAGQLFGADDESMSLIQVNTNSGFATAVANQRTNMALPFGPMDFGMSFTCDGTLLVSSDYQRSLFSANTETGVLSLIGVSGSLGAPITDIAAWGDVLYGIGEGHVGASGSAGAPNLYRIDPATATATLIGPLGSAVAPYANAGLAFDAEGTLWAVTDRRDGGAVDLPSQIVRIDLDTGIASHVANADVVGFESLAIAPPGGCNLQGEPEPFIVPAQSPGGLAAMILALLALAWWTLHPARR